MKKHKYTMKEILYMRWHRFENGIKIIKNFSINENPNSNHLPIWTRGTGPFTTEQLKNIHNNINKTFTGKSKSPEQKLKMSLASKGRSKSTLHKQNMKQAWINRKQNNETKSASVT